MASFEVIVKCVWFLVRVLRETFSEFVLFYVTMV